MRVTPFVITLITLLFASAPQATSPTFESAVPFELFQDSGIVIPVTIDGRGPFRFLLDTGASHSAISATLASRLELTAIAKTLVTTPAGETWRAVVRVRNLALGPVTVREILPSIVHDNSLQDAMRAQGVLGQDVLAALHYTLDYSRRVLSWGGAASSDRQWVQLPLEWIAGCPIVRTGPAGRPSTLRLIPDSGASHVVLFDAGDRALPPHHPGVGFVRLDTLGERRAARPVMIPELWIGPIVLRNQAAAVIGGGRREADGVLPLHLFRRVTVNGPAGYLLLESQ